MRRAPLLLTVSIALCSCAAKPAPQPSVVVPPVIECPAPSRPVLPALVPELPFDHPANIGAIMERDDLLRGYVHGLESCVRCYQRQSEAR